MLDSSSKNVLARYKMWRYNSITRTSSDLRRDEGEQATVLREFANHPLSTGVVQSTVIYYFFVTLSAATFPLSGRQGDALGVVVGKLTKKSYVQQRLSNTWTRPKY